VSSPEPTPEQRIAAFWRAVDEELLAPARRYLQGFRVGLVLGLAVAILVTPWRGESVRGRLAAIRGRVCRCRRRHCG
jgi:ABC-type nitrate/sulfonate/bicarbonate transport system permease component